MARPQDAVILALDVVKELQVDPDSAMPVRVDSLVPIIQRRFGLPIELWTVKWPSKFIKGRLLRYQDRADIHISNALNTCWARFVAAKELAHLLIDPTSGEHFTASPEKLVECLVSDPWSNDRDMESERLAVVAAVELLIPQCCCDKLETMKKNGATHLEIATHFMIPERMVDRRLSPRYVSWAKEAYEGTVESSAATNGSRS